MSFSFREAKPGGSNLLILLSGGTGSGKTLSAIRIAKGLSGGKRFAVIDTENGRASHYARDYEFYSGDLRPPFTSERYAEAIKVADDAGYPVVICDSWSHSWSGEGGVLEFNEAELTRMAGDDWKKREACRMASWVRPKMAMKAAIQRLLQVRAHVILCLRAEAKIEMVRGDNGKMEVRAKQSLTSIDGWLPICSKELPFEATMSFLLMADNPGVLRPVKLQSQHRPMFDLTAAVTEDAGHQLAIWAAGGSVVSRADILAKIAEAGKVSNLTDGARVALWKECCGSATKASATVGQLTALLGALEKGPAASPSADEISWASESKETP